MGFEAITRDATVREPARNPQPWGLSGLLALLIGITCGPVAAAQEPQPAHAASPHVAATAGISTEQMATLNNPLAAMVAETSEGK
jgi:hypothetical protein